MSHDTHAVHHTDNGNSRPGSSFTSAIWFTILMAFLFIAAVNFVKVMSHDDGGHGDAGHGTEHAAPAHGSHGTEHSVPAHSGHDGAGHHEEEGHAH